MSNTDVNLKIKNAAALSPGCGIAQIARDIGVKFHIARYYVLELALNGELRLERTRGRIYVYPVTVTGAVQ